MKVGSLAHLGLIKRRLNIQSLPFEMLLSIVQFCAADESFNLIRVSREVRLNVLLSKSIIFKRMFVQPGARTASFAALENSELASIQKYFKIMENAGTKDLFLFYELLIWGLKEGNLPFLKDQIETSFPRIVYDCVGNRRTLDRFLAFFTTQVAEMLIKIFDQFKPTLPES